MKAALIVTSLLLVATPPVKTPVGKVVDRLHGVDVPDPYRWLETSDSPEVKAWTDAQNALTRKAVGAYPGRKALEQRLWAFQEIGTLGVPSVRGKGKNRRLFYPRRDGKQNQAVLYVREGTDGEDRVLVDVNREDTEGTHALDWWFPSPDGKLVAYGVSASGDEKSTLRVRVVATGKDLPDAITRTRHCAVAWKPDGKGFYYTRYPIAGSVPAGEEEYHRAVFFHALGGDPDKDRKVFGDGRDLRDWPSLDISPDGRWLTVEVQQGWAKTEIYLVDTKKRDAKPVVVVEGKPFLYFVQKVLDGAFYLRVNDGAPRYKLYAVDPRKPSQKDWTEILPETEETLEHVSVVGGKLVVHTLRDASSRLRVHGRDGKPAREIALPALGTVTGVGGRWDDDQLFWSFTSFLTPTVVFRHDVGKGTDARWLALVSPVDPGAFEVEQERAKSRDGTEIPYFLVRKKGLVRDGQNPTLLYGYGGFNISETPGFAASMGPFLEKGGVYALANLRGGGEYGEAWHRAGMLDKKQNAFDDFIAVAERLIASKVTSRERLAIKGGSNGGLLVGAAITQRPDLFRAAVCGVPLLDMIRYHKFRIAQLWIPEYGSSDDPEQFRWLWGYSPYHRVKDGVAYPATLLATAESDSRVDPMHARKMTARLQAAQGGKAPILLRLETRAGHGAGKPTGKIVAQLLDEWSFVMPLLGLP